MSERMMITCSEDNYLTREDFIRQGIGVTYDELLLRPTLSTVESRSDVDVSTELWKGMKLKIPIISSPMSTISGHKMCIEMYRHGGLGVLHRFQSLESMRFSLDEMKRHIPLEYRAIAVGVRPEDNGTLNELGNDVGIVCVDVNIGHHVKTIEMVQWIKKNFKHIKVIAGNVSTYEGTMDLIKAGADCIRATNGAGSVCTTLTTTGVGVPSATSLVECVMAALNLEKTVIADGGIRDSGTVTKALALGAHAVMLGGALAGTNCCPYEVFFTDEQGQMKARYFGMASANAQKQRPNKTYGTPEGRSIDVPLKGETVKVLDDMVGGLRSGMSFCDSYNISELQHNAKFMYRKV